MLLNPLGLWYHGEEECAETERKMTMKRLLCLVLMLLSLSAAAEEPLPAAEGPLPPRQSALETELVAAGQQSLDGAGVLRLMVEADRKLKDILGWVFGEGNDLDAVLGGVNLLAVAGNGERVIVNLMTAVRPVLEAGAKACVRAQVDRAVEDAEAERARRKLTMDN